jgi:hypothetical protein
VRNNTAAELLVGESVTLTREHLEITGADPATIELMLLSPPEFGVLLREGSLLTGGDLFSPQDIAQGRILYRHEGTAATEDSFIFASPDGSLDPVGFHFRIHAPKSHSPELSGPGSLDGVLDGIVVSKLLAGTVTMHEANLEPGIAIIGLGGRGHWQWSSDLETWNEIDDLVAARALLLGPAETLRFTPKLGWSGVIQLSYRVWNGKGTIGDRVDLAPRHAVGEFTSFSRQAETVSVTLAPMIVDGADGLEPWQSPLSIGETFGGSVALLRASGEGVWQIATDGGRTWIEVGNVYHGRALLLLASYRIRFVPRSNGAGRVVLGVRLWDETGFTALQSVNLATKRAYGEGTAFGEFVVSKSWRLE